MAVHKEATAADMAVKATAVDTEVGPAVVKEATAADTAVKATVAVNKHKSITFMSSKNKAAATQAVRIG